jgi:hypothetical protein
MKSNENPDQKSDAKKIIEYNFRIIKFLGSNLIIILAFK